MTHLPTTRHLTSSPKRSPFGITSHTRDRQMVNGRASVGNKPSDGRTQERLVSTSKRGRLAAGGFRLSAGESSHTIATARKRPQCREFQGSTPSEGYASAS